MYWVGTLAGCATLLLAMVSPQLSPVASAQQGARYGKGGVQLQKPAAILNATHLATAIDFAPSGRWVATAGSDGTVRLWDVGTGRLLRVLAGHGAGAKNASISPDSRLIASIGADKFLRIWNAETGELIRTLGSGVNGDRCVFSPTGRWIAATTFGEQNSVMRGIQIWDADSGRLLRTFGHSPNPITALAVSPDGRWLVSGGWDKTARLWDVESGKLLRTFSGHSGPIGVYAVAIAADRSWVASADVAGKLKIWDPHTGRLIREIVHSKELSSSPTLSPSPDGKYLAVGSGKAVLLNTSTWRVDKEFSDGVSGVAFSPDSKGLVVGTWRADLTLIAVPTGSVQQSLGTPVERQSEIAIWPGGSHVVLAQSTLRVLDLATGALGGAKLKTEASAVAVAQDGKRIVFGSYQRIGVVDASDGKLIRSIDASRLPVYKMAASSDLGFAVSYADKRVALWNLEAGVHARELAGHTQGVAGVAISPDDKLIASIGFDNTVRLWNPATGKSIRVIRTHFLASLAFSPDGEFLAAGGSEGLFKGPKVTIWRTANGAQHRTLSGARDYETAIDNVIAIAFAPNGQSLVTATNNKLVGIWDLHRGIVVQRLEGHSSEVQFLAYNADGSRVVGGSSSEIVVWDAANGQVLATFVLAPNGEWLTLTPEGFFHASERGGDLLHVVQGFQVTALTAAYQSLYRPDLVREKLAGDPSGKVREAAARLDLSKVMASGSAPRVAINSPAAGANADTDEIAVEVAVTDQGGGIGRIEWRVNGVTLGLDERGLTRMEDGGKPAQTVRRTLSLEPGENKIEVVAYNARNLIASEPATVTVAWDGERSVTPPKLHVLAVGVNDYWDSRLKLAYAVPDARALGAALAKAGAGLYGEVKVTTLTDAEVTTPSLDKAFAALSKEVHPRDTFALFVAGHGKTLNGRYYFLPHDFRYAGEESIEKAGIDQDRLQAWLAQIRARKTVLLFDTCESGSLTGDRLAVRGLERVAAFERLTRAMGRTVISASSDDGPALEGYRGHGAFTYVLLEALGAADINKNGLIEVGEIADYLEAKLPDLTFQAFKLRQVPHRKMVGNNFALAGKADILSTAVKPAPSGTLAARPTHVVTAATAVREAASGSAAVVVELGPGTQVALIETSGGWALVGREGKRLGYLEEKALARLQ